MLEGRSCPCAADVILDHLHHAALFVVALLSLERDGDGREYPKVRTRRGMV